MVDKVTKVAATDPAAPTLEIFWIRIGSALHANTSTSTGICAALHARPRLGQVPQVRNPRAPGLRTCATPRGRRLPSTPLRVAVGFDFRGGWFPFGASLLRQGLLPSGRPALCRGLLPSRPPRGLLSSFPLGPHHVRSSSCALRWPRSSGAVPFSPRVVFSLSETLLPLVGVPLGTSSELLLLMVPRSAQGL